MTAVCQGLVDDLLEDPERADVVTELWFRLLFHPRRGYQIRPGNERQNDWH
jgi:hypothetical protein